MIELTLDNEDNTRIELPQDAVLNFDFVNSFLQLDTAIVGSFHFGLKLSVEKNEVALSFFTRLESQTDFRVADIKLVEDGVLRFKGKLIIKTVSGSIGKGSVSSALVVDGYGIQTQGKSIRDVVTDEIILVDDPVYQKPWQGFITDRAKEICEGTYPDELFCFPMMKNTSLYGGSLGTYMGYVNHYSQANDAFSFNRAWSTFALCPSVFMLHVLKNCFSYFGYTLDADDVLDDPLLQRVIIPGFYALDEQHLANKFEVETNATQVIASSDMGSSDTSVVFQIQNYNYTNEAAHPNIGPLPSSGLWIQAGDGVMSITLAINFGAITASSVDIGLEGFPVSYTGSPTPNALFETSFDVPFDEVSDFTIRLKIAATGGSVEILSGSTFAYADGFWQILGGVNGFKNEFRLGDCLPKTPIPEFLVLVKLNFGLNISINPILKSAKIVSQKNVRAVKSPVEIPVVSKHQEMAFVEKKKFEFRYGNSVSVPLDTVFMGEYDSLDEVDPEYGKSAYDKRIGAMFVAALVNPEPDENYFWDQTLYWKQVAEGGWGVDVGEGDNSYSVDLGYSLPKMELDDVPRYYNNDELFERALIPADSMSGVSPAFSTNNDTWELKMMVWHGFQNGEVGVYPLATPYDTDYEGESLPYSMILNGEDGLYVRYWNGIENLLNAKTVEITTLRRFIPMDPSELPNRDIRLNGIWFVVSKVDVSMSMRGEIPVKITLAVNE